MGLHAEVLRAKGVLLRYVGRVEEAVGFGCLVRGEGVTPAGRELAELARTTGGSLRAIAQRAKAARSSATPVRSSGGDRRGTRFTSRCILGGLPSSTSIGMSITRSPPTTRRSTD